MIVGASDKLTEKPGQTELINRYIASAENALMEGIKPLPGDPLTDGGLATMIGLGREIPDLPSAAALAPLVPDYVD